MLVAPTAFQRLATAEGERATARAAGAAGTVMILSTLSNTPVEVVVVVDAAGPVWFHLYVYRDHRATEGLVRRAETAGCRALVLTGEPVRLSPAEEAELLEAAEQIQAGDFVDGRDLLHELRSRAAG